MARLIEDAAKLSDTVDAQDMSFANIVEAINVVQTEMGITGTTAKEAASTIQGSVGMMKASWTNLVTGIADENANLDLLITNFVDSVGTAAKNIVPKIGVALNGVSRLVRDLIPVIVQEIPVLIEENLPILAEAAISIVQGLVDGISENQEMLMDVAIETITYLAESLITMLPQIVELGLNLIVSLANGISKNIPKLLPTITNVILSIVDMLTSPQMLNNLIDAAIEIILAIAEGLIDAIPDLIRAVPEIIDNLIVAITDNLPKILEVGVLLLLELGEGLIKAIPELLLSIPLIIGSIVNGFANFFSSLVDVGVDLVLSVKEGFIKKVEEAKTWGKDLIQNFIDGILARWNALKQTVSNVAQTVKDFLGFSEPEKGPLSNFHTYAPDMMDLFIKGIKDNEKKLTDQIEKTFDFGEKTITAGVDYVGYKNGKVSGNRNYGGASVSIVQNIYSEAKTAADLMQEALYQQERAVLLGV